MINRRSALVIAAKYSVLGLSALALASCGKAPQTPAAKDTILAWDLMNEWAALAESEPEEIEELDMEF